LRVLHSPDPTVGRVTLLADHTTLRLGGPARRFVVADTAADLVEAVCRADTERVPVLVLGGGSNLVVADEGFDGLVVQVAHKGLRFEGTGDHVVAYAAAGEEWDTVVAAALAERLAGIECLSGIPGLVGATPIQNVGAYGTEIADVVVGVRAFDRVKRAEVTLDAAACGFGYRTSALKGQDRYLVLEIEISLTTSGNSAPVRYAELGRALDIELGGTAAADDVRRAVLGLRAAKGMLVDPADPDSVSAGSFFTNPLLTADALPQGAPSWPVDAGRVKTSAAWLIEHAGFARGYRIGAVGLSTKHTLALVNCGGASTSELLSLAGLIRDGVRTAFGITLEIEPALVGVTL
jgi:UDP-N-acetylmuramate dehydrogenase